MTTTAVNVDTPAIAGGKPAKSKPFGKFKRYGPEELKELTEALEQGSLFYAHGKKVKNLEAAFAKKVGAKHAVASTSGTAAIHAAIMAAGISPGDEVLVPPITDMGTVIGVLFQGAIPVFVDLDPQTYNMDPAAVEKAITPRTKAMIPVHLAGNACDLKALKKIADQHKLWMIEDCAQAHGCTHDGKPVGTVGQMGCYSYNEFKHISCGDGGVTVTNDDALAAKIRLCTDKAYNRAPNVTRRDPTFLAANYRMTELQGAVAHAQLGKLDHIVTSRRSWCERLTKRLASFPGLWLPKPSEGCEHSYWFYMLRVQRELGASADEFAKALAAEGLPAAAHYIQRPLYHYPLFIDHSAFEHGEHPYKAVDYKTVKCPVAEEILHTCVILQINEGYDDQDLDETVKAFERVVHWFQSKR
ncbi:MAG TPA: DegT/DnrJ/EryC1/StrS family aminotransferase [Tepidisphaeraceae bacterium]|jgi:dTDP-4-amino-4,6-dideoxygalactose transaminase